MHDVPIHISGLTKRFGQFTALDELDLRVERGEVHGFLGPNGAGKSTTIRVLLGLLRADAGAVSLLGADPWSDAVDLHRRLAYVPGDVSLWPNLSGGEAIDLLGHLRGGLDEARRRELLDDFELDPRKRFDTYSKGNRQKVALIAALASRVELYLLDEPTSGLDPLKEDVFRAWARRLARDEGATILLSSHILAEVDALCERVTIIRDGRTVEQGALADLRHLTRTTMTVQTERDARALDGAPGVAAFTLTDTGAARIEVEPEHLDRVIQQLAPLGVRALESAPPSLEDLFLRHYTGEQPAPSQPTP